jgi:hypothetical protein
MWVPHLREAKVGIGAADLSQDAIEGTLFRQPSRPTPMLKLIGVLVLGQTIAAHAQQGPIEPTWIYTTPLHWKHAPRGINESWSFAQLVVLYPEGQYLEVRADLIKRDKDQFVTFSVGDGQLYRAGTWERTDDRVIRIHSRDVWKDNFILNTVHCDANNKNCVSIERPIPGSITTTPAASKANPPPTWPSASTATG